MSNIIIRDLETHEVLDSETLSGIRGGKRPAESPISRPLFIYSGSFGDIETHAVKSIVDQQSTIENDGILVYKIENNGV
jgi:hypothetical protein